MTGIQFEEALRQKEGPLLVAFVVPGCPDCGRIAPALERIARGAGDRLRVETVDTEQERELKKREQIELEPTLVLYREGRYADSIVLPDSQMKIEEFIRENLEK